MLHHKVNEKRFSVRGDVSRPIIYDLKWHVDLTIKVSDLKRHWPVKHYKRYTPLTRSNKHRAVMKQTSSKCIRNTRARRVL